MADSASAEQLTGKPTDVSVVIPALNEQTNVVRAVASAFHAGATEVIVVDGGSSDTTRQLAQAAGASVIDGPAGRAKQQNAGARVAQSRFLLFLHADNWLARESINQLTERANDDNIVCGAFRQRIEAAGWQYRAIEAGNAARVLVLGAPYGDQSIFVRRSLFESVGGFPETDLMEDVLLMRKLRKTARPVLLPGPVHVDARRWKHFGVARQTLRNLCMIAALQLGASPNWLANFYPRHDHTID